MAILAFGTSVADFYTGSQAEVNTTTGGIGPYVNEGLRIGTVTSDIVNFTSSTEIWFSAYFYREGQRVDGNFIRLLDENDQEIFYLTAFVDNDTFEFRSYDGTSTTTLVSDGAGFPFEQTVRMDIRVVLDGVNGVVEAYLNGAQIGSTFNGNTNPRGSTGIAGLQIRGDNYLGDLLRVSAIMVSDESTLNVSYVQTKPTGAGNYSEWNGAYTDVDEVGYDDSDYLVSYDTLGETSSFTKAAISADFNDTDHDVLAVGVSTRAWRATAGTVWNLETMVRSGTSDSYGTAETLELTKQPIRQIFSTDPNTASAWTVTSAGAAEIGVRSSTS